MMTLTALLPALTTGSPLRTEVLQVRNQIGKRYELTKNDQVIGMLELVDDTQRSKFLASNRHKQMVEGIITWKQTSHAGTARADHVKVRRDA